MGILQKLNDVVRRKDTASQEVYSSYHKVNPLCSNYENMFAQVRPLIDEMKTVFPYGIGRNGARLAQSMTPELNVLLTPNDEMGWMEFADLCFSTWLTEDELDIHVHMDKRGKVYGYSILPIGCKQPGLNSEGKEEFLVPQANGSYERLTSDEVAIIRYSRSPRDILKGVSPTSSVEIWAQVDDLIAQYERAFYENGAIPATVTFIRASTKERYLEKRRELEMGLKGARNRNKTVYAWRAQLDDGSTGDEIEVKTIQGNNSTMAIKEIMDIVTDKLNKSIGVSNFILGDDSSAKYDNAELSDHQFTKRRVFPALLSFWGQFQFELDRITGGLGYAISFDLDIPELTDRLKVKAETAKVNSESLMALVKAGASPEAAVEALEIGDKWLEVAKGVATKAKSDEALALARSSYQLMEHNCSHNHAVDAKQDPAIYTPVWELPGDKPAKAIYDILMGIADQLAKDNPELDIEAAKAQINKLLLQCSSDGAVDGAKFLRGLAVGTAAKEELGQVVKAAEYMLSDSAVAILEERTGELVQRFSDDVLGIFNDIKNSPEVANLTKTALQKELQRAIPTWRAETIARTETHSAINAGRYDLDQQIADKYGLRLELIWDAHVDENTCPVCAAMDGKVVEIGAAFPEAIMTDIGEMYFEPNAFNDYGRFPNAHPNCRCTFSERVVRG